jgi:hypothetical protein
MPPCGGVPHPKRIDDRPLLGEMVGNGLRECLFVQLPDGGGQDPLMRRGQHVPGFHGDPKAVEKTKVTLICSDESPPLLSRVLEVKRIVSAPQAELHRSGNIIALLCEEWSERQGNAFIQVETGHALLDDQIIAIDPLLDFRLVPLVVTERSLEFFFS